MPRQFDDWGNPIKPPSKPLTSSARLGQLFNLLRRYRTLVLVSVTLIGLWNLPIWTSHEPKVNWNQLAYVQYATDSPNLCNALMVFDALHRYKSKASRVLLYARDWDPENTDKNDRNAALLRNAAKKYNVKLKPVDVLTDKGAVPPGTLDKPSSWDTSITKLQAFKLEEYDRLIHLDNDINLQEHLDHLFFLPAAQIAMPRSYMKNRPPEDWPLSTKLMVFEPSTWEYDNMLDMLQSWKLHPKYETYRKLDMILINHRFDASAMILPHRPYILSSAEFRQKDHSGYLGTRNGPAKKTSKTTWDAKRILSEAKVVHFNDAPLPKPWIMWPHDGLAEIQPDCDGLSSCDDRKLWKDLYYDFRSRRKDICRILSVGAPKWDKIKNVTVEW